MAKRMIDPRKRGRGDAAPQNTLPGYGGASSEAYIEEETGGITVRTMKRAGRFMWISVIFLILCLTAIFMYANLANSSIMSEQRSCWVTEQSVEQLAQRYVTENGFSSLPAYVEDIPGFENVYQPCPTGGSYTWNPITGQYSCSEHAHWPEGFNQAESINQGTTTVMIEAK